MVEVRRTAVFDGWLRGLRDRRAAAAILTRIDRIAHGNFGDAKSVRGGLIELRVDVGAGYRAYCVRRGDELVILLCGGDKGSQRRDIARALEMAGRLTGA